MPKQSEWPTWYWSWFRLLPLHPSNSCLKHLITPKSTFCKTLMHLYST
jgi:hypothetical protein